MLALHAVSTEESFYNWYDVAGNFRCLDHLNDWEKIVSDDSTFVLCASRTEPQELAGAFWTSLGCRHLNCLSSGHEENARDH